MNDVRNDVVRFLLTIAAGMLVAPAAHAQSDFSGAGETSELDCDGGTATISGASNTMRVTGRCTRLVIEGAGNRVEVDLASKGAIRITGASNQVAWTTPDGSKARVSVAGAGNRVYQRRR